MDNRLAYTEDEITAIRQTTSGFYKQDPDQGLLLFGRFYVLNSDYELHRHLADSYTYPVDGWAWYESEEQARQALNCPKPKTREELMEEARHAAREQLMASGHFTEAELESLLPNLNT
mgnify:CR=1 FL=1|jgi:hypothetical protein